jgi:hypothetical protein
MLLYKSIKLTFNHFKPGNLVLKRSKDMPDTSRYWEKMEKISIHREFWILPGSISECAPVALACPSEGSDASVNMAGR